MLQQVKTAYVGMMDQIIDLLTLTEAPDDEGIVVTTTAQFPTSRPLWARVERTGGTEEDAADLPTPKSGIKVEMRFVSGVTTDMRLVWQGEQWEIVHCDPRPREDRLYLTCMRRGQSGDGGGR